MTHRGIRQTFASSLPTLLRLARTPGKIAGLLGCRSEPRLHAVPAHAREVADLDWSHCPLDLITSPYAVAVAQLDQLSKVAPLAGWPERYAFWAVDGLIKARQHRGEA